MSRVTEFLADHEAEFVALDHPAAATSLEEALALGLSPMDVAKTLVIVTKSGFALALIPASRKLDLHEMARATGDTHARLATEDEIETSFAGFELGAIPPVGHEPPIPVYVDAELTARESIVFASGRQTESVRMRPMDLMRLEESVTIGNYVQTHDEDWTK